MKRSGLICLVALLALGSLGMSYATWSQNLTVHRTATTGTLNVIFDNVMPPSPVNDATFTPAPSLSPDKHTLTIYLNNIYPSLNPTFTFDLKDSGTVPAKITHIIIKQGSTVIATDPTVAVPLKLGADTNFDISVTVGGIPPGTVIPANSASPVPGSLLVHCWSLSPDGHDATAGASGSFTVEIDTAQEY